MQPLHAAELLPAALRSSTRAFQPSATILSSPRRNIQQHYVQHIHHAQQQVRLVSCKAAKQQQQQPKRDRPDMGRRSSRKVKIPTPEEMLNPEKSFTSTDPESQGFQERALLMAFMENLDPAMKDQFAQYMDMQVQRMEQQQDVAHAAEYMQSVIDKAGDRAGIAADSFDADAYVNSTEGRDIMWQSLREQFSSEEQSLLDDVLGPDWQSFGEQGLTPEAVAKISSLSEEQGAMLTNMLARMEQMDKSMDVLVERSADDAKPSSSSSSRPASSGSSSSWGSSFRKKKSARVRSKATEAADKYWDKFLDGQMTDKMQKMMFYASQASKGQLTWGRPPSQQFTTLKQTYTDMVQLEGVQLHEPGKLSSDDVAAAYARINYTLNMLASQLDSSGGDTATRSALLYMDALFNSRSSSSNSEEQAGGSSSEEQPGNSSSSQKQQQQQQGSVDLSKLQRLGRFLKAAENLDAFQTWLSVFADKHPGVTSPEMIMMSNLGGDDWFLKPQQQEEAFAAAQAAAAAWQQAAAGKESSSSGGSSSGGSVQSAISGALLPYIDEGRIEALATLDAATLWFLTELEVNNYSEDVLMKWSLHPEVSQKLMQGNWFDESEMSESIKKLYQQAQVPGFMAGFNFDLQHSS